jgi:hypothetical protein
MSNDIRKYISILTEDANLNQKYYDKNDKPDLDAFPDIAGQTKNDNGDYGPFQQWLIDNKDPHQKHFRAWKAQSPTPNAYTDTGMIQQYFDQNLDQYSEFINWYEENKARFSNNAQAKIDADKWMEKFNAWLAANPDIEAKYKRYKQSKNSPQSMNEVTVKGVYIPNELVGSAAAGFLQSAQGIGKSFMNFIAPKANAAAQGEKEPDQDPADTASSGTSSEPVAPDSSGGSGANPSDQAMGTFSQGGGQGGAPQDQTPPAPDPASEPDEGDFEPGSTQPADDFNDEREGNSLKNPYDNITVSPDGSLNKPKPGTPEFDQEGNVVAKPNVPNQAPVGGSGSISSRPGQQTAPAGDQNGIRNPFDGGTNTTSTATTTPATQSATTTPPQQQQPPVPKPRPAAQPKYYPGVTEPDYNKSLRIAQNTLKQAQQKLSQGNLSNLDKMQAQTDVQRQNQLINMYQNDLLANPRTERGNLIHHRNMLNRSAVASGQAGDQKTRAGYKKQAAQVSQQLKTVKESRFTNLQNYINKL